VSDTGANGSLVLNMSWTHHVNVTNEQHLSNKFRIGSSPSCSCQSIPTLVVYQSPSCRATKKSLEIPK